MSTPVGPQGNAADSQFQSANSPLPNDDATISDGGFDGRTHDATTPYSPAPASAQWSDAQASGRSAETVRAPQVEPLHAAPAERRPDVQFREGAPAVAPEPVTSPQPLVQPDPEVRAQPMAVGAAPDRETVVAREHERFGGMKFGSAFFGWLTATGLAVLLLAILAAAGVAFGVATSDTVNTAVAQSQNETGTAKTVGLVGAIVLLVILFVSYYCGGYVAGRMARFDGVKQGLGVWIWALITSAVIAAVAAIAGAKYNVLAQLHLPRIPVDEGSVTTVGIIAIAAAILVALLGALLGGAVGTRFHRKVDAVGFDDTAR
jgi:hypothetical protein